jgi:arylsulfatase A
LGVSVGRGLASRAPGRFKGVRRNAKKSPPGALEIYDLAADPAETRDIAFEHPEVAARMEAILASRTPSPIQEWNFGP